MVRAAVLIGVAKTGKLPRLNDAVNGALRMKDWALANDFALENIYVFTDASEAVDVADIRRAISILVASDTIEQLIIYFAGHGVNIGYSEFWLLSGAPGDGSAAVNVEASLVRARQCGIPHVVFISDACRTPAATIQAQGIEGSVIFPNDPVPGTEKEVDIFFAATLGRPALELKETTLTGESYRALYTDAFLDGLRGKLAGAATPDDGMLVVRPRALKASLVNEIPRRFGQMGFAQTIAPCPDARITSGDKAWLARFPETAPPLSRKGGTRSALPSRLSPGEQANSRVDAVLQGFPTTTVSRGARWSEIKNRVDSLPPLIEEPVMMSTIAVKGARVAHCLARGAAVRWGDASVDLLLDADVASVLLVFADHSSTVIVAVRGVDMHVVMEQGEFVDLRYAPAGTDNTGPQSDRAEQLRLVHDAVAVAALAGQFALEGQSQHRFMRMIDTAKDIDLALVLYGAYALHRRHMHVPVQELHQLFMKRFGFVLFDLALLAGAGQTGSTDSPPSFPLMAQGWPLLAANDVRVPQAFAPLRRHLMPSLWTHFNAEGTAILQSHYDPGA